MTRRDRSAKVWARAHDQVGARPVVPRQRAARRRDADADRPLRARSRKCCSAAAIASHKFMPGKFVFPGRTHRAARPRRCRRSSELHPDTQKKLLERVQPTPSADYARALRARGGARDGRGNRAAARRQARRAAGKRRARSGHDFAKAQRASRSRQHPFHRPRHHAAAAAAPLRHPLLHRRRLRDRAPNRGRGRAGLRTGRTGVDADRRSHQRSTCRPSPASCSRNCRRASPPAWRTTCRCRFISWRTASSSGNCCKRRKSGFLDICGFAARFPPQQPPP